MSCSKGVSDEKEVSATDLCFHEEAIASGTALPSNYLQLFTNNHLKWLFLGSVTLKINVKIKSAKWNGIQPYSEKSLLMESCSLGTSCTVMASLFCCGV